MGNKICNMGYDQQNEEKSEVGIYSFKRDVIWL